MISHQFNCIFIHIPKCAGTSIETALGHFENFSGRGGQDHRTIRMIEEPIVRQYIWASRENCIELLRRVRYQYHREPNPHNKLKVTDDQYRDYFKFTFVRNPWARAYSWFKNVTSDEKHRQGYRITDNIPLNQFLQRFAGRGMLRTQMYWITGFDGSIPLDFIGRFESLKKDFQEVCRFLGIPPCALPHKVRGNGDDYREHYDQDSIELVSRLYRCDIERFGYSFES